jgi:predicted nucleotide-binding protein
VARPRRSSLEEIPVSSTKVKVFIGSSTEGKKVAEALKLQLKDVATSTIWSEGVFGIGKNYLESLTAALSNYEFAILVLTPDDEAWVRGSDVRLPRDNVLFELGLFTGQYGRKRVFVVHLGEHPKAAIHDHLKTGHRARSRPGH